MIDQHDAAAAEGLVAGPDLDAEVARVVFGIDTEQLRWHPEPLVGMLPTLTGYNFSCTRCGHRWSASFEMRKCGPCFIAIPPYSTDIAAAWTIVERMREIDFDHYTFFLVLRPIGVDWPEALLYLTPEQICKAARRALQGEAGA